jgi:hypothetical protein
VQLYAIQKAGIYILCVLLPFIPPAVADSVQASSDGTTVTVQPVKVGIEKYKNATSLTEEELVDLLSLVGFKGYSLKVAWAVVMRESHGHPLSHNKNAATGDNSYGLFQINMLGDLGADRREKFGIQQNADLLDPVTNAKAAYYMTNHGKDFGSWGLGPNAYDGTSSEVSITNWLDDFPKS